MEWNQERDALDLNEWTASGHPARGPVSRARWRSSTLGKAREQSILVRLIDAMIANQIEIQSRRPVGLRLHVEPHRSRRVPQGRARGATKSNVYSISLKSPRRHGNLFDITHRSRSGDEVATFRGPTLPKLRYFERCSPRLPNSQWKPRRLIAGTHTGLKHGRANVHDAESRIEPYGENAIFSLRTSRAGKHGEVLVMLRDHDQIFWQLQSFGSCRG